MDLIIHVCIINTHTTHSFIYYCGIFSNSVLNRVKKYWQNSSGSAYLSPYHRTSTGISPSQVLWSGNVRNGLPQQCLLQPFICCLVGRIEYMCLFLTCFWASPILASLSFIIVYFIGSCRKCSSFFKHSMQIFPLWIGARRLLKAERLKKTGGGGVLGKEILNIFLI